MGETETEFNPADAEKGAHARIEERVAAIEAHLGIGEHADDGDGAAVEHNGETPTTFEEIT